MARTSQMASRRYLFCCVLLVILFTLMAYPQPVGAAPQRHSLAHRSFTPMDTTTSTHWAGYVATQVNNPGAVYTEATISFTVPTLPPTPNTQVGIWVGLGGGPIQGSVLVQAGIASNTDSNGNQTNYAFWEIVGGSGDTHGAQVLPLAVHQGDQISVYVGSNSDHNSGYDGFSVTDGTQQPVTYYDYNPAAFSDSGEAECVVEAGGAPLANFSTIAITNCNVYTNGQGMKSIGSFNPSERILVDQSGTTLALPGSIQPDGTDFGVTWQNAV